MNYFYATFSKHSYSTDSRGGIVNCKDINTTTSASHSADPSTFSDPIFPRSLRPLCWDFYFMKCFGSTIFKLSWSKCIKCGIALFSPSYPSSSYEFTCLQPHLQHPTKIWLDQKCIHFIFTAAHNKHEQKKDARRLYLASYTVDWRKLDVISTKLFDIHSCNIITQLWQRSLLSKVSFWIICLSNWR